MLFIYFFEGPVGMEFFWCILSKILCYGSIKHLQKGNCKNGKKMFNTSKTPLYSRRFHIFSNYNSLNLWKLLEIVKLNVFVMLERINNLRIFVKLSNHAANLQFLVT
jgi:hypothetical protein